MHRCMDLYVKKSERENKTGGVCELCKSAMNTFIKEWGKIMSGWQTPGDKASII